MKVISPIVINDAVLNSSSVAENEYSAWSAATDYAVGARVIRSHVVYESVQNPNLNHAPESSALYWAAISPSNRWAMFDSESSTSTTATSSVSVNLRPVNVNALALIGLVGSQVSITVNETPGGTTIYQRTVSLDGTLITDWYQYYFEPFTQRGELAFTDLPPYSSGEIIVAVTGSGTVAISQLILGNVYTLGKTFQGAQSGIVDYSRKDVSAAGVVTLQKRKYSRRMSVSGVVENGAVTKLQSILANLRATPCVWIAHEDAALELLIVFGFYRDFSIDVSYSDHSLFNLEIEGMT